MAQRDSQPAAREEDTAVELGLDGPPPDPDRARMLSIMDSLSDAIVIVDSGGNTVARNQRFVELFETAGIKPLDPDGRAVELAELRDRTARGESFQVACCARDGEGRERWFEVVGLPASAAMGSGDGGTVIVHETTDFHLRRLQEDFVGIVAHELRTPLTALRGYLQMLDRQRSEGGATERPILPLALRQADRLNQLVDELFDVTLAGRGGLAVERALVRLGPLVRETVDVAQGLSDTHRFHIEEDDAELIVLADRGRLEQVLLNILTNSLVHAPESPDVVVRLRLLRRRAEIQIEDHGPGIQPDLQARLFSRFERGESRGRGLGLGLYIAREIVNAHDGTIDVDSRAGHGTTFTIRVPLADTTASVTPKRPMDDARDALQRNNGANSHNAGAARPDETTPTRAKAGSRSSNSGG